MTLVFWVFFIFFHGAGGFLGLQIHCGDLSTVGWCGGWSILLRHGGLAGKHVSTFSIGVHFFLVLFFCQMGFLIGWFYFFPLDSPVRKILRNLRNFLCVLRCRNWTNQRSGTWNLESGNVKKNTPPKTLPQKQTKHSPKKKHEYFTHVWCDHLPRS